MTETPNSNRRARALGLIGLAKRAGKLALGADATLEALNRGRVQLLIFAEDASSRTLEKFEKAAAKDAISVIRLAEKANLGRALGRESAAVIAITDPSFAAGLLRILKMKTEG